MLSIDRLETGAVTVLRLSGDIDENGMNDLRTALMSCIQDHRCNVVVNLKDVKFVSYMGVGVLVERLRQLRSHKGDMKLTGVNLYTERLFRMVGVTNVFATYATEDQAIRHYQEVAA
ncbi:MAG: STAS domain-containing protein [Candidatus Hydrogenedentes bacterium]|nr:STAS domain-containing protein [Candidatus Hydrogenedentota bacterium]